MILDNLRELEEAYQNKWILSTSQLLSLLDLKKLPSSISFERYGFIFTNDSTQTQGQYKGWRVTKETNND